MKGIRPTAENPVELLSLSLVTPETITSVRSNCYYSVLSMDLRGLQWPRFYRCPTWARKQLTLSQHWSGWERELSFTCIVSSTSKVEVKKERSFQTSY